ncbi:MAG: alpha/beta hydrolase [Planctomycetes bacterium]|nr:alpha/beta hydrolase [Planctomycetota bacterium]
MRLLALVIPLFACGCAFLRPATTPMPMVLHEAPGGPADTLVVLLPGLGDGPDDYFEHGFVTRIQQARPRADVIAVDAHFGYYRSRTLLPRLQTDVLDPVADRYDEVWLVGISMGGFGAAIFCKEFRGTVDGLILLAPYMGEREVIASVRDAGGLANWVPPMAVEGTEDEADRKVQELWAFYREYAVADGEAAEPLPKLYLGWGTEDGLRAPLTMLAEVLPEDQVVTVPGGHEWTVWKPLFDQLVERALGG